jgi:hypothetical protein
VVACVVLRGETLGLEELAGRDHFDDAMAVRRIGREPHVVDGALRAVVERRKLGFARAVHSRRLCVRARERELERGIVLVRIERLTREKASSNTVWLAIVSVGK